MNNDSKHISSDFDPLSQLESGDFSVRVSFWWIRQKSKNGQDDYRFLYSYVVPSVETPIDKWFKADVDKKSFITENGNSSKKRIIRLFTCMHCKDAFLLIKKIVDGENVSETISLPDLKMSPFERATGFLGTEGWMPLRAAYFPTKEASTFFIKEAQGRKSISADTGCYCTRFSAKKRFLFAVDEIEADKITQWVANALTSETGIEFNGQAGDAFENIEIFMFPALDRSNRPLVRMNVQKDKELQNSIFTFTLTTSLSFSDYIVQLRAVNLQDIAIDQLQNFDETTGSAKFHVPEPVDGIDLRIWKKDQDGMMFLWHENEYNFIREMHTSMNLIGLSGNVSAPWLDELKGSKMESRANAFSSIAQVSTDIPMSHSTRESWETNIQNARKAIHRLYPNSSGAKFWLKGWSENEYNKLEFADWLKKILSTHKGSVLLTDPYFDLPGLDLILRASGAAKEIGIVTCCQAESDDDELNSSPRSERLVNASKKMSFLLSGVKLKIFDLQSKGGGNKRLFHDRYLLFFDGNGQISKGFNLSTSLQSATRTTPLLVTSIPDDVLDDVADYANSLLHPNENNIQWQLATLYTPELMTVSRSLEPTQLKSASVLKFAEIVTGNKINDEGDSKKKLYELGYVQDDNHRIQVPFKLEQLQTVITYLSHESPLFGAVVWNGVVWHSLSNWYGDEGLPEPIDWICKNGKENIASFLYDYLISHAQGSIRPEDWFTHNQTLAHLFFNKNFLEALTKAESFAQHHHEFPLQTSWPIYLACLSMLEFFPEKCDQLIVHLKSLGDNSNYILSALASALFKVTGFSNQFSVNHLIKSNDLFIRAMVLAGKWNGALYFEDRVPFDEYKTTVENYSKDERIVAWSRSIYDLRIRLNQRSIAQTSELPLFPKVVSCLLEDLQNDADEDILWTLLPSFSGPILGSWAFSTYNEILTPLVDNGTIAPNVTFKLWNQALQKEVVEDEFIFHKDLELIFVWGHAFWKEAVHTREQIIDTAIREIHRNKRKLYEPFLKSRDYRAWKASSDRILLWMLQIWAIVNYRQENELSGLFLSLTEDVKKIVNEMNLFSESNPDIRETAEKMFSELDTMITTARKCE